MEWFEEAIEAEVNRRLNDYVGSGNFIFDGMTTKEQRAINLFIAGLTEKEPVDFARELIAHYGDALKSN